MFNYFGMPQKKKSPSKIRKENRKTERKDERKRDRQIEQKTAQSAADREKGYGQGIEKVKNLFNDQSIQGLEPDTRQSLQYEANKGIQRNMQSANRKLLGDQASHGIVGKGGVGYAQQRDLQRLGIDAQAGVQRDLTKLNSDLALKKKAAMFAGGQGEASQTSLDRQMALDELYLNEERKKHKADEKKIYSQFSRL